MFLFMFVIVFVTIIMKSGFVVQTIIEKSSLVLVIIVVLLIILFTYEVVKVSFFVVYDITLLFVKVLNTEVVKEIILEAVVFAVTMIILVIVIIAVLRVKKCTIPGIIPLLTVLQEMKAVIFAIIIIIMFAEFVVIEIPIDDQSAIERKSTRSCTQWNKDSKASVQ